MLTTMIETTKTPKKLTMNMITLPKNVLGKKSPYPTVVIVMKQHQVEFQYELKPTIFLEADNGSSAILNAYPKMKIKQQRDRNINFKE